MAFNGSFGDKDFEEEEEEINWSDLAKMKEKEENENSFNNIMILNKSLDTVPKNNDIFNSVFTKEIKDNDNIKQLEYLKIKMIQEKINYSLTKIISIIATHTNSYKRSFIWRMKYIVSKKYSKLVSVEVLFMRIKTKLENLEHTFKFIFLKKLIIAFNKIKIFSCLKKREHEKEQIMRKEKENRIQNLNNKLNTVKNNLNDVNMKINILNNIKKKQMNENKEIKNKNDRLNEKYNQLINVGNSLKESIAHKKKMYNSNQENIIKNLQQLIEQKEEEKEKVMNDVDNFYKSMDVVLSQYESISETILSNCNINIKNN